MLRHGPGYGPISLGLPAPTQAGQKEHHRHWPASSLEKCRRVPRDEQKRVQDQSQPAFPVKYFRQGRQQGRPEEQFLGNATGKRIHEDRDPVRAHPSAGEQDGQQQRCAL